MLAINYSQNNEEFTCQPFAPTLPCKNNTVLSRCATNSIIHPLLSMIMVLNLHIVIRLIKNCILSKKSDIYYYWYTNLLSLLVEQQARLTLLQWAYTSDSLSTNKHLRAGQWSAQQISVRTDKRTIESALGKLMTSPSLPPWQINDKSFVISTADNAIGRAGLPIER